MSHTKCKLLAAAGAAAMLCLSGVASAQPPDSAKPSPDVARAWGQSITKANHARTCSEIIGFVTEMENDARFNAMMAKISGISIEEMFAQDFDTFKRSGRARTVINWSLCVGDPVAESRFPFSEADRDKIAALDPWRNAPAPTGWEARSQYRWTEPPSHIMVGDKMPSYLPPGIICPAPDDAWLQALGQQNSCRSFDGGWLVSLETGGMSRPGFKGIIATHFRTETGEDGFLPPSDSLGIERCDTISEMRRYVPGGAPLDPHCVAFARAHGWSTQ
jgi:hypothetical protein